MKYFLAIDIGASSGRHILGNFENGKLILDEIYRFPNSPVINGESLLWDTKALHSHILEGLKKCKELNKIPVSVGIDTWGVDYALLDSEGKTIEPVFSYRDQRTANFFDTVVPFEEMYKSTGIQFQSFNTVYQLLADKSSGKLEKAEDMLMMPEYFSYLLTAKKAREYTNASTTGLLSATVRNWDYNLIDKLNLPKKLFSDVKESGFVLGDLTQEVQEIVGFNTTVVMISSHDTASAVLAAPSDGIYISSGTWSLLGILSDSIISQDALKYNYANEGQVFGKVRFLKNIMGLWVIQQVRHELNDEFSFIQLADMAKENAVYDWNLDLNKQVFLSPKSMIEAIKEECKQSNQPIPQNVGEIAHLVFNSLAICYKNAIEDLEKITGKKFESISIIGGGSNNHYLNTLTAKHTGKDVFAGPSEATAAGNLLLQAYTYGEIDKEGDMSPFSKIIKNSFDIKHIRSY